MIKLNEFQALRTLEEQQFKASGNKFWREEAHQNYNTRLRGLAPNIPPAAPIPVEPNTPMIDASKVVDDMFGFLDDDDGVDLEIVSKQNVNNFRAFFEKESRVKKNIPSKLLAVPVFAQETRL